MSNDEFRRRITEVAIDMDDAALAAAIGYHERAGKTENWHVPECIELASHLTTCLMKDANKEEDPVSIEFDAAAALNSDRLREMITPEVEALRLKLFEAVTPPFSSWEAAAAWVAELPGGGARNPDEVARARQLYDEWSDDPRRKEFEEITGAYVDSTIRRHSIPYVAPGGDWVMHKPVSLNSPYMALGTVAKRLANQTGFNEASVVLHILYGHALILPSIRITKTLRVGGARGGSVRVEFNSPDVTQDQVAKMLKLVREFWGKSARRRTNVKDMSFLKIIEQLGGVPDSGRVQFFERVGESCMNEGLGSYEKSGWRGPYRRWKRLMEREPNLAPVKTKEN